MRQILAAIFMLALVACAKQLPQVPASTPHGRLLLRVVHASDDALYEDGVRVDRDWVKLARSQRSGLNVRLAPGVHQVQLWSEGHLYEMQSRQVDNRYGSCIDPKCTTLGRTSELQSALVEVGQKHCKQALEVTLTAGQERVALLVVGPGKRCVACLADERAAMSCPEVIAPAPVPP